MPDEPHNYHCNNAASEELRRQSTRAKQILERLAAHLAATELGRDPDFDDLVEAHHVRQAAELLLGSATAPDALGVSQHCVFVSFSHEDEVFVNELSEKLSLAGITHFKADRDIQPAADWGEAIWDAIRGCRVFLLILTPRFISSRWSDLEGGAACASRKQVLTALRYVERSELPSPFDRFQSIVVENNDQLDVLVSTLKTMCDED